jgi:hypothetical protein
MTDTPLEPSLGRGRTAGRNREHYGRAIDRNAETRWVRRRPSFFNNLGPVLRPTPGQRARTVIAAPFCHEQSPRTQTSDPVQTR